MNMLETLLLVVHVIVAAAICGLVLLQHGKGADMGAAFGSGSSGSVFGASGSANFLSRSTAILAALFFASSLGLTWFATSHGMPTGLMQQGVEKTAPKAGEVPPVPGTSPANEPPVRACRRACGIEVERGTEIMSGGALRCRDPVVSSVHKPTW